MKEKIVNVEKIHLHKEIIMESAGIEPAAFSMPRKRSSTNPRPQ